MKKIALFGAPATGKTTLARRLSAGFGIEHTALDQILFTEHGALPLEEFRAQAAAVTDGEAWIVEGNFSKLSDVVWDRADVLVWLDFPLPLIVWRLVGRSLRQLAGIEANEHRITVRRAWSMVRTAVRKYRKNRPRYVEQVAATAALGVTVVRLRGRRQADAWLKDVTHT